MPFDPKDFEPLGSKTSTLDASDFEPISNEVKQGDVVSSFDVRPDKSNASISDIRSRYGADALRNFIETPVTNYLPEEARKALDLPGQMQEVSTAHPEDKSFAALTGAATGVKNIASAFTTPLGLATLGIGSAPKATQKALSLAFAAQMATQIPDVASELGAELGKPKDKQSTEKIARLITEGAGTVGFSGLAALHGVIPELPTKTKPNPVSAPAPDVSGATLKMPEGAQPPPEPDLGIKIPNIPSHGPNPPASIPDAPNVKVPVTVPETPPEAERGISVVEEIRQNGAKTIADIQRLFPQAQLTRESARKLRNAAWENYTPPEKGAENASQISPPTTVHGDVRSFPVQGKGKVPVQESSTGVQPRPEAQTQVLLNKGATPEAQPPEPSPVPPTTASSTAVPSATTVESAKPESTVTPKVTQPPVEGSPTAMKYRLIDQERQQRGLPPLTKPESVPDQVTMDKAIAAVDKNPELPNQLVSELNSKPRAIEDWERMVLLLKKIDLRNQFERSAREASKAFDQGRTRDAQSATVESNRLSDELTKLEEASRVSGSAQGRGLRALRIMANEDYSLASMETQRRAAKGGAPLTDTERAELMRVADEYKKANEALQSHLDERIKRASQAAVDEALSKIAREASPVEPHVKIIADKVKGYFDKRAQDALKRLSVGTFSTPLPDLIDLGVSKIISGSIEFAQWSAEMVKDVGERVRPYLQAAWDASNKALDDHISSLTTGATREKVKTTVKTAATRISQATAAIARKVAKSETADISGQVQKLARAFVESGVTDRDKLIDSVHGVLQKLLPDMTRRDTMDAISGYGDFKQLSKDEISVKLRGMKGEMQQISKLEDMARGVPPSKTGIEHRTPTEEERKLIKAVNESKIKFQVPITDPTTQLKSALDTRKTQLKNSIADLEDRIKKNDYATKPRRELALDRTAQELQLAKDRAVKKFKQGQNAARLAARSKIEKAFDFLSNARRFAVLSGANVLAKLAAYSATRIPITGVTEVIGGALSKLPGLRDIAGRAASESGLATAAYASSVAKGLTKGFTDSYKTLRYGQSDLKSQFGNRPETGREWYNFFGTVHEAIKSPLRRQAFELSLSKRMIHAAKSGVDITDPLVQVALSKDAYLDSDRALLLENNKLATAVRGFLKKLEEKGTKGQPPSILGKAGATAGRIAFPILTVPFNYMKQTLTSAFGLVTGSLKARSALKAGVENLTPEEADNIMRHLKYGTIGGAMLLYGFYDGYKNGDNGVFGGYYQKGEKRKENQAGVGGIKIGDVKISGLLLHNPVLAVGQLGHTIGAIAAQKHSKKNPTELGLGIGAIAGTMGLINDSPIGRQFEFVSDLSDPRSAEWALGESTKSLFVPQIVQEGAQLLDRDSSGHPIKRAPVTIPEHIKTGIPGLRQTVPKKTRQ